MKLAGWSHASRRPARGRAGGNRSAPTASGSRRAGHSPLVRLSGIRHDSELRLLVGLNQPADRRAVAAEGAMRIPVEGELLVPGDERVRRPVRPSAP